MLRVKSSATSSPLMVSSQVIHDPHGMPPPAQFICVPFRLVHASTTSPNGVTRIVVVPPRADESYGSGVSGPPNAPPKALPFSSWLRTSHTLLSGRGEGALPSCRPRG